MEIFAEGARDFLECFSPRSRTGAGGCPGGKWVWESYLQWTPTHFSSSFFFSALFWSPPSYNDSALIILIVGGSETKLDRCISDGASMLEPHISPLRRMGVGKTGPTSYIIACHIITCKRQKTGYQTSRLLVLKKKISSGDPDYVRWCGMTSSKK